LHCAWLRARGIGVAEKEKERRLLRFTD